jgi:hypothetical protein
LIRGTRDIDVAPDPAPENLELLDSVLRGLGGKVEVGERLLDSVAISTFLRQGSDRARDRDDLDALEAAQEGEQDGD